MEILPKDESKDRKDMNDMDYTLSHAFHFFDLRFVRHDSKGIHYMIHMGPFFHLYHFFHLSFHLWKGPNESRNMLYLPRRIGRNLENEAAGNSYRHLISYFDEKELRNRRN